MSPLEILRAKSAGKPVGRQLFCPAVYEHKAKLLGRSISDVSSDAGLLQDAVSAEYEIYRPDMLTVGVDIYNVEAEALGAEVLFSNSANVVPSIKNKILEDISQVGRLKMPDVAAAGRIPVFLAAAQGVKNKFGNIVPIRGALSGPYSFAAELMGIEPLIMAMMTDEAHFCKLLDFTSSFSIAYGMEYIKRGISICIFDSQASPPLVSPAVFEKFLLPRYKKIADVFKTAGCDFTELVIGGKTDGIAKYMLQSGCDIVLSDFSSDIENFIRICNPGQLIRRNISPVLIENGPRQELMEQIKQSKNIISKNNNVIIGTGVISYDCPVENVLEVKKILKDI